MPYRTFLSIDYKKDVFEKLVKRLELSTIKCFSPCEKLHQHFFTIHYYLLPPKNPAELVKSEKVKIPHYRAGFFGCGGGI